MTELLSAPAAAFNALGTSSVELAILGVAAFFIGIVAGMIGIALGIVRLPVLLALGFNPVVAAGTNLAVSVLGGLTAAWPHYRDKRVVARVVIVFGAPAIAGSFAGALMADSVPSWVLLVVIAFILATSALYTLAQFWQATHPPLRPVRHRPAMAHPDPTGVSNLKPRRVMIDTTLGLGIGVIGGAVGMVLGALRLPVLVNVLRMDPRYAAGTNNAVGIFAGAFGFAGHALRGNFDLPLILVMGATGMIGSYIGATQTGRVSPTLLRGLIGVVLLAVTPLVVIRAFDLYPG